jgi:hypothetical protein
MKVIYAALDPNNFFRFELNDTIEISAARKWLRDCPYKGILWIDAFAYHFNLNSYMPCKIEVGKDSINVVVTTWDDEYLLDDDLIDLPDVYLTKKFRIWQEDAEKYLSEHDKELVSTWEKFQKKFLEN